MGIVDFILNLAGLLVWLNWRSIRFDPLVRRLPATLMGTLRPAAPAKFRRWHLLALIGGLLILRAAAYRWLAPFSGFKLDVGLITLSFRSDSFAGMVLFSVLSFSAMLGVFYVMLLLLSLLRGPEQIHRFVKIPLGRIDDWSAPVKLLLPFLVMAIFWGVLSAVLSGVKIGGFLILPPMPAMSLRIEQSVVIALGVYLLWKFPIALLLVIHLLSSYIYFGKHPFWVYVNVVAQKILRPLNKLPLRIGRVDFAPLLGLALVFLIAVAAGKGLMEIYRRLPI